MAYYKSPNPPFSVALPLQMTFLMSNVACPSGEILKFVHVQVNFSCPNISSNKKILPLPPSFGPCSCPPLRLKEGDLAAVAQRLMLVQRLERAAEDDVFSCNLVMFIDVD